MLNPEVYKRTYGIKCCYIMNDLPPLFIFKPLLGNAIVLTSPYITNTYFGNHPADRWNEYVQKCVEFCKKNNAAYLLLKICQPDLITGLDENQFHIEHGFVKYTLDISVGEDKLWKKIIPGKTRNQIKKGLSSNPIVRFGREELLDDFYNIIAITQTDLGTPVHSIKFFRNILASHTDARLAVVYLDGVAVSSALIVFVDNTIFHPYAGTLNEFKHTCVNNVLYWEIIKFGIQNGCEIFDMGRSQKGSGAARYKKSWGGNEIQLYYAYCLKEGQSPPKYDAKMIHYLTLTWKHIPVILVKNFGHLFARFII
jgi:hypothetical protein